MNDPRVAYVQGGAPAGDDALALYEALGVADKLRSARSIFIKLNLCAAQRYSSEGGVCVATSAVVELVRSLRVLAPDADVRVGDSDSTGYGFAHDKFRFQELPGATASAGFELLDLTRDETVLVDSRGDFFPQVPLARFVAEADVFVNLTKIKTHNITRVTGTLKNAFGMLPQGEKKKLHPYLNQVLTDIHFAKPADLCVLDGRPAMQGNGPIHGEAVDLGLTLFGNDALAADAEMCHLIGIDPRKVSHLRHLAKALDRDLRVETPTVDGSPRPVIPPFIEAPSSQRRLIQVGLTVQSWGTNLEEVGHLIHFAQKLGDVRKVKRFVGRAIKKGRIF